MKPIPGLISLLVLFLAGCESKVAPSIVSSSAASPSTPTQYGFAGPWFEDVTKKWGIDFLQQPGSTEGYPMPQINGTGVAMLDFDADGRLDLYFLQGAGADSPHANRLYRQSTPGDFTDVSQDSGLDIKAVCTGVAVGDVNNDGLPEVLVNSDQGTQLFLNLGQGKFKDITAESGVKNSLWATSATFFDYDRDGWLDLFVANYVESDPTKVCKNPQGDVDYCPPVAFQGTLSKLYHHLGQSDDGAIRYEDATESAGLAMPGPALGVIAGDFTADGWPDLLVANDAQPNWLWVNMQNGNFMEEGGQRGVSVSAAGVPEGNMGIAFGDADGDGLLDLFVTHLDRESHTLWRQIPHGMFVDQSRSSTILAADMRGTGFGTVMQDFDHDGDVDVAIVNGRVVKGKPANQELLGEHFSQYAERNHVFMNDGTGKFSNVSEHNAAFCGQAGVYRGLACGDLDNDGALDLIVTRIGSPARVLRNIAGDRGHWLTVRALDPALKRDAFGAEVVVRAGKQQWVRRVQSDGSYQSASSPLAHFGLGKVSEVDAVEVQWPDGSREVFPGVKANQAIECVKGSGK